MTYTQMLKLQKMREWAGLIGWLLMIINLCIGFIALIISFITNTSITTQPKCLVIIMIIAMIIGILAALDGIITRKISRYSKQKFKNSL